MKYVSTRGGAPPVPFAEALAAGLAPDGGLYVPQAMPRVDATAPGIEEATERPERLAGLAAHALAPFLAGDRLAERLDAIAARCFAFPVPLVDEERASFLELFHGPTAAFKDVGARFLAGCFAELDDRPRTVLVATSGDTGGAVAAAFHGVPGIEVAILYPDGGVSLEQEHQLTCWGDNVRAFAVDGTFDDCQALLKEALGEPERLGGRCLTTANSINVARVLGQVAYYAAASTTYAARHGRAATFVVPTGNVGNATAALWAKHVGFPVARLVLATNANRTLVDYAQGGEWAPRPSVATLANAMDVGNPSNMERVFRLYPTLEALRRDVDVVSVSDDEIRATIQREAERGERVLDPHTAAAVRALELLEVEAPVVVATAHAAKFASVVEPLVGVRPAPPPALAALFERPTSMERLAASLDALAEALGTAPDPGGAIRT